MAEETSQKSNTLWLLAGITVLILAISFVQAIQLGSLQEKINQNEVDLQSAGYAALGSTSNLATASPAPAAPAPAPAPSTGMVGGC